MDLVFIRNCDLNIFSLWEQIMVPFDYVKFFTSMKTLISTGVIPMSRINDAVTRILRVKFEAGLFESPYADNSLEAFFGSLVSSLRRVHTT